MRPGVLPHARRRRGGGTDGAVSSVRPLKFMVYDRREHAADLAVHSVSLLALSFAVPHLFAAAPDLAPARLAGLALYATGLTAMVIANALYNASVWPPVKGTLRKIDHSAILVMIAGTYSGLVLGRIDGTPGVGLLAAEWVLAALGVALIWIRPHHLEGARLVLYLLMGWAVLLALEPLGQAYGRSFVALVLGGGALITIGVAFHLSHRLRYHNAVWHAFVVAGAICHYVAILDSVAT
jgi:hemolysin III